MDLVAWFDHHTEQQRQPHYYVPTEPYRGCDMCGLGPGAFRHNEYEVDRFILAKLFGYVYVPGHEVEVGVA